jgi:hypothetical protein
MKFKRPKQKKAKYDQYGLMVLEVLAEAEAVMPE